ncbi:MAG: hypothetical protein HY075_02230 [Deltaproteobacteria bacterium]|nr:hypothetical protein [Deltaproteobacteria bacterium]
MVLKRLALVGALLAVILATAQGCGFQGEISGDNFKFLVEPQTVPGAGPLGGVLSTLGIDFPFDQAIPQTAVADKSVTEIYLSNIALRTVVKTDTDASGKTIKAELEDDGKIGPCANGQATVDFLKTLDIYIQKSGGQKTRIAHFKNTATGSCGFFMDLDIDPSTGKAYNLKAFLPSYTITTSASGSSPASDVKLGGYVGIDWVAPDVSLPQQKQQQ